MTQLSRSTPEAQGLASSAIQRFLEAAEANHLELHSLMLLRHGYAVAEGWWHPYQPDRVQLLYSLSKSFTATAVGFAVQEGMLRLEDTVLSFFPEQAPTCPSPNLVALTVRDLLTMTTGHTAEPWGDDPDWPKIFFSAPLEHPPGTHFLYNTPATYMAGRIVQQLSGQSLLEYLRPRLFEPLGFGETRWESCPQGYNVGGWGLSICTEDIAKFGQLYLQKGLWEGRQILSREWVEQATAKQINNFAGQPESDWQQGYGFQFWRCRYGAYRADGAFGQFCIVLPEQDAVLAITSRTNMQAVLDLVWEHLLPAMGEGLLESPEAKKRGSRLQQLSLELPAQTAQPAFAERSFRFEANELGLESLTLENTATGGTVRLVNQWGRYSFDWRVGEWEYGVCDAFKSNRDPEPWKLAAAGGWSPEGLALRLCFYETPFTYWLRFSFSADRIWLSLEGPIGFGPAEHPVLEGRLEGST